MFHTVIIAGNVGRDAEMRYTPSGQAVASFSVATNREYMRNDEKVKETIWFRISAWGKQAEVCNQYVKKGMKVLVEGRLTADQSTGGPRIWSGNDGAPKASFEVTAATVRFLSSRGDASDMVGAAQELGGEFVPPEDDIPF